MNTTNSYPYSPEVYLGQHPEKFEQRRQPLRMVKNVAIAVIGVFILFFPGVIPFFKLWLIYLGALVAIGYGVAFFFLERSAYFNLQSGGEVKGPEVKKFRNSRDERVWDKVLAAFAAHDFGYLSEAPSAKNQPLQLYIYEDRKGREFYIQMRGYNEKNEFEPLTDVITISGTEYDTNADLIRAMKTEDED